MHPIEEKTATKVKRYTVSKEWNDHQYLMVNKDDKNDTRIVDKSIFKVTRQNHITHNNFSVSDDSWPQLKP